MGKIDGQEVPFLVDTGATLLLINFKPKDEKSLNTVVVHRVIGRGERALTQPLLLTTGGKGVWGRFVISTDSPSCLPGRVLLQALGTQNYLHPEEVKLVILGSCVLAEAQKLKIGRVQVPQGLETVPQSL